MTDKQFEEIKKDLYFYSKGGVDNLCTMTETTLRAILDKASKKNDYIAGGYKPMTKKLYGLISGLLGAAATAASVCVAFFQPANYGAIIAAIGVGAKAIDEILLLFVKEK